MFPSLLSTWSSECLKKSARYKSIWYYSTDYQQWFNKIPRSIQHKKGRPKNKQSPANQYWSFKKGLRMVKFQKGPPTWWLGYCWMPWQEKPNWGEIRRRRGLSETRCGRLALGGYFLQRLAWNETKIKKPRTYRQRSFLGMLKYLSLMAGVSIERKKPCLCIHHFFLKGLNFWLLSEVRTNTF